MALAAVISGSSMWVASTENNHFASIDSNPLFIMVAESTDIFLPIFHLGCFKINSIRNESNRDLGMLSNGPPEAVRYIFDKNFSLPSTH